ncbi:sulfite exporter TauE/SafE family protein [Vibrio ulleungensis]|uniref:Sulfite exporter TauE/SafE family protein n=1 Tax=Vibrio ulleungensis TaxID=2807619 RepID=A0ABS2HE05_9VIBR|nr:sulfite exporter TauE/SafE family protein [Vibrio ulleungensis]MBM7035808.1 sulfite exporter TauE/SafE family protein [Vibrio ulleungensis]
MDLDLAGAFAVGLFGTTHCVAMCGGISTALAATTQKPVALFLYSVGRLFSYSLFGAFIGGAVASSVELSGWNQGLDILRVFAGILMVLLGLYIAGWYRGISVIEKAGRGLWRLLTPLAQRLLPLKHSIYALPLGMLWGWLPCGLVYSMLSWAAMSGSASGGAQTMLAFGIGTLPAMLSLAFFAQYVHKLTSSSWVRKTGGILLILLGLYTSLNGVI